ncbi:hypothetical protein QBC33DRAFT_604069 [Phialemonium atrogriseum]|uniref:LysM domain-containing protein n=1 Tax=Phialemonium atrogriseum TaxID=1093897 RepID=A0AAJ0FNV1_9PEZI|nr:uncharacterized protein QBC33DRAFT_604069 [Phialemonium atrogriseum]KAK1769394.1 hypothetical protein QBC33DRAFT_604069 [Phialemonium atrogriseum]
MPAPSRITASAVSLGTVMLLIGSDRFRNALSLTIARYTRECQSGMVEGFHPRFFSAYLGRSRSSHPSSQEDRAVKACQRTLLEDVTRKLEAGVGELHRHDASEWALTNVVGQTNDGVLCPSIRILSHSAEPAGQSGGLVGAKTAPEPPALENHPSSQRRRRQRLLPGELPGGCQALLDRYCFANDDKPVPTYPARTPVWTSDRSDYDTDDPSTTGPSMVDGCQKFYKVVSDDTCDKIASDFDITLELCSAHPTARAIFLPQLALESIVLVPPARAEPGTPHIEQLFQREPRVPHRVSSRVEKDDTLAVACPRLGVRDDEKRLNRQHLKIRGGAIARLGTALLVLGRLYILP